MALAGYGVGESRGSGADEPYFVVYRIDDDRHAVVDRRYEVANL
jgi:hypothetical protein